MNSVLTFSLGVLFCSIYTDGCQCIVYPGTNHIQTDVCNSELSFIGDVIDSVPFSHNTVKVIQNVKGINTKTDTIYNISPGWNTTSCFPTFSKNKYLFTAELAQYGVGRCDLAIKVSDMTHEQYGFLSGIGIRKRLMYKNNCRCKITNKAAPKDQNDTCELPSDAEERNCLYQTGICIKRRNRCIWHSTRC